MSIKITQVSNRIKNRFCMKLLRTTDCQVVAECQAKRTTNFLDVAD